MLPFASRKHKHSEDDSYDHPPSLKNRRNASLILIQTELRTMKTGKPVARRGFFHDSPFLSMTESSRWVED